MLAALVGLALASPLLAVRGGRPEVDRDRNPQRPALSEAAEIEAELGDARRKDVRDLLRDKKTDLGGEKAKGKKSRRVGRLSARDPESVKRVRHRKDDDGVFLVEFEGPELIEVELPVRPDRSASRESKGKGPRRGVIHYSFSYFPAVDGSSEPKLNVLQVDGATLGFGYDRSLGPGLYMSVLTLNGDYRNAKRADWIDTGIRFPLNEKFEAPIPIELMLRVDREEEEWDLYFMNRLHYAGLVLGKKRSGIWLRSAGLGKSAFTHLMASEKNPLYEDGDLDGVADSFEIPLGFSARENDRHQLDEMGEFTNLQHFVNARMGFVSPAQKEIEATIATALALAEDGEGDEEIFERKIPDELRKFSREELAAEAETAKRKSRENLRNLRKKEDRTEDPAQAPGQEGGQP